MKRLLLCALVSLLVASLFVGVATYAAADGTTVGTFPTRQFNVVRSSPGGPHTDTYTVDITPDRSGSWSVKVGSIAGSAVIVEVYRSDAGILTLESSSKLRFVGQSSTATPLIAGLLYKASFTPYGHAGTSQLLEQYDAPYAPVAAFTFSPAGPLAGQNVTFDGSKSSDLNNNIASYAWNFGDGTTGSGKIAVHAFAAAGTYVVNLTVTDTTNLSSNAVASVVVSPVPNVPPVASFTAARSLMVANVDGSASKDSDGTIVDFTWDWGDGNKQSTGTTPTASHTYAAPGKYTITLAVTDNDNAINMASHDVTVNTHTEDWRFYDFFNVPYGEWWDMRKFNGRTGDAPIGSECFTNDTWCTPTDPTVPDYESFPYTDWVNTPNGDALVAAPYRFTADVKANPAFTANTPVMLPTCPDLQAAAALQGITVSCPATLPSGGSLSLDEHIGYLTTARANDLATAGCPDLTFLNDGFITELQATITMDNASAARLFGVTDGSQWAFGSSDTSLLKAGCGTGLLLDPNSGVLEKGLKAWYEAQGNGPYDIQSAFGSTFSVFSIEATGSYNAATGQHTLVVDVLAWGFETLFARWAYWGATSYVAGLSGAAPAGWWSMEHPWTEDLHFLASFGPAAFSAAVSGVIQYHFRASASAGPDQTWFTADDVPMWVWQPVLGDRFAPTPTHLNSELKDYAGLMYIHTTPGSHRYGTSYLYDYVPAVWQLGAGDTQRFEFPTTAVKLFNPYLSGRLDNPMLLVSTLAPIVLGSSVPATGVGSYDLASNVLVVIGPTAVGTFPTTSSGKPLESRPIYELVHG